jgi:DNA-binding NarL/FixJ family response regulator
MNIQLKIALAETSSIIRSGLEVQLKKLSAYRFQFFEITDREALQPALNKCQPDVLVINPTMTASSPQQLREDCGCLQMKCVALVSTLTDPSLLRLYDEQISIYDTRERLKRKFEQLCENELPEDSDAKTYQALSKREKEIVVCVVKGMTNREIASRLFLSAHTIVTHRRNIARKLQIHSASGLTVYAIVNKLVELSDIHTK